MGQISPPHLQLIQAGFDAQSLKLQHSHGSRQESGKENWVKSHLCAKPCISVKAGQSFTSAFSAFKSAHVPTASQKGSAAFTVKGQGMISGSQRAVCPRGWLDNVIEQAPALAGQSSTLLSISTPPSLPFFLIGCLTNQQIDHVCSANR